MILRRRIASDQVVRDEAVNEADGAVMAKLETLGEFPNGDVIAAGKALDRKQCLVMLRRDSGGARGSFAKVQKAAKRVAKGGEEFVLGFGDFGLHDLPE
jgi:hypothetical protein